MTATTRAHRRRRGHHAGSQTADGLHERFLELAERCRALSVPSAYVPLLSDCSQLMNIPLAGYRAFGNARVRRRRPLVTRTEKQVRSGEGLTSGRELPGTAIPAQFTLPTAGEFGAVLASGHRGRRVFRTGVEPTVAVFAILGCDGRRFR